MKNMENEVIGKKIVNEYLSNQNNISDVNMSKRVYEQLEQLGFDNYRQNYYLVAAYILDLDCNLSANFIGRAVLDEIISHFIANADEQDYKEYENLLYSLTITRITYRNGMCMCSDDCGYRMELSLGMKNAITPVFDELEEWILKEAS